MTAVIAKESRVVTIQIRGVDSINAKSATNLLFLIRPRMVHFLDLQTRMLDRGALIGAVIRRFVAQNTSLLLAQASLTEQEKTSS